MAALDYWSLTDEDKAAFDELIADMLRDGKFIDAMKEFRSASGMGLKESAMAIGRIGTSRDIWVPPSCR